MLPKVNKQQGGDVLVVEAGGAVVVKNGGALVVEPGGALAQQPAISDLKAGATTVKETAGKVNEILEALRSAGIIAGDAEHADREGENDDGSAQAEGAGDAGGGGQLPGAESE